MTATFVMPVLGADTSVVLDLRFGQRRILLTGDIEDDVDVADYTLASGKEVEGLDFKDFVAQHDGTSLPGDLSYDEENEVVKQFAERIVDHWVTFRVKGRVKIGTKREKDVEIRLQTYFGEAYSTDPFKFAIKNSDVFLYNGHSMIGFGPLDPKNFSAADFPASYQILFIDSCISYNYYDKAAQWGFIPHRPRFVVGLHAAGGKCLMVCPDGFWRKGNVDIVCERYAIPQFETLEACAEYLRSQMK